MVDREGSGTRDVDVTETRGIEEPISLEKPKEERLPEVRTLE